MLLFLLLTSNFADAGCGDAGSCRACMTFNTDSNSACGWMHERCLPKVVIPDTMQAIFSDCSNPPPTPTCSDHSSCESCVQDLRDYETDDGTKVKRACDYDVSGTCVDIADPLTASWRTLHTSASYDCPVEEAVGKKGPNCGDAGSCRACMTFNKGSNPACGWINQRCVSEAAIPDATQAVFSDCSKPPPTCSDLHSTCESCVQDLRDYETEDGTKVKRACDWVFGTCNNIEDPVTTSWRLLHTSASYDCPVEKEPEECVDNLDKLRKDLYDDEATCASAIKSYGDMICSNTLFSPLCCATCAALSSAREEAVGVAVRSAPHQTPSLVTAFAALGLVATLYGAYQHYVSK